MRAREALIHTDVFGYHDGRSDKIVPVCTPGASDTARFDEVLELLHLGGRSLPHAVLMMIPEAWERHESMDPARRAFYEYHDSLMEPWDGPASVCFTDGTVIGAVLDRNGLRPSRIWVTERRPGRDGVRGGRAADLDPSTVVQKMRLQPGRMFLVDTAQGRIVADEEIKAQAGQPSSPTRNGSRRACSTSTSCRRVTTSGCRTTAWCCASRSSATPTRN